MLDAHTFSWMLIILLWMPTAFAWQRLIRSGLELSPLTGWLVGLTYFMILPLTFVVVMDGYQAPILLSVGNTGNVDFDNDRFIYPLTVAITALIGALLVVIAMAPRPQIRPTSSSRIIIDTRGLKQVMWFAIILTLADATFQVAYFGGVSAFLDSYWYSRWQQMGETLGEFSVLYARLSEAVQVVLITAFALFLARLPIRRVIAEWKIILFASSAMLFGLISGNRIYVALFCILYLVQLFGRARFFNVLVVLAATPLLVYGLSIWASVRSNLSNPEDQIEYYLDNAEQGSGFLPNMLMTATEGADAMMLLHVIEDFGDRIPLLYGQSYLKILLIPVPRFVYADKPDSFPAVLANLYATGEGTSINSTLLGELYANFSIFCIPIFAVFTWLVALVDRYCRKRYNNGSLVAAVICTGTIWTVRVSLSETILIFAFPLLLIWLFSRGKNLLYPAATQRI